AIDRPIEAGTITTVDPGVIGEIGRPHVPVALGVCPMTSGAVHGEDLFPTSDRLRIHNKAWLRFLLQRLEVGDYIHNGAAIEDSITPEGEHFAGPRLRVARVDADAQGLEDRLRLAAPQPAAAGQAREAGSTLAIAAMADRAVVAKEAAAAMADDGHQVLVGPDLLKATLGDRLDPVRAGFLRRDQLGFDRGPLVDPQEALGVAHANGPSRHQHPVDEGEDDRDGQEDADGHRDRGIEFLDTVPLMPRGHIPRMGITLTYRHGRSSSSMMLCAARSKRLLLDGQSA